MLFDLETVTYIRLGRPVLADLSLTLADGATAVVGPSGAGNRRCSVRLILLYVLLSSVALAALTATLLAYRNFFTAAHQLRDQSEPASPSLAPRWASGCGEGERNA